ERDPAVVGHGGTSRRGPVAGGAAAAGARDEHRGLGVAIVAVHLRAADANDDVGGGADVGDVPPVRADGRVEAALVRVQAAAADRHAGDDSRVAIEDEHVVHAVGVGRVGVGGAAVERQVP